MVIKEHYYKGNKIIEYPDYTFMATTFNEDGDIETNEFNSLEHAKNWLDKIS